MVCCIVACSITLMGDVFSTGGILQQGSLSLIFPGTLTMVPYPCSSCPRSGRGISTQPWLRKDGSSFQAAPSQRPTSHLIILPQRRGLLPASLVHYRILANSSTSMNSPKILPSLVLVGREMNCLGIVM